MAGEDVKGKDASGTKDVTSGAMVESRASDEFADTKPQNVGTDDSMDTAEVAVVWGKIYAAVGAESAQEPEKRKIRTGCYTYCALNGTSRVGRYSGKIRTADGRVFAAAVLPLCVGKQEIRRFMRGNMLEAYRFFKRTKVMEDYPRFVAKWEAMGVGRSVAFATADFLTDCPLFTPEESSAHAKAFRYNIEKAKRARGGKSLEEVEAEEEELTMEAQGPEHTAGRVVDF